MKSKKVLIIDDEEDLRFLMKNFFTPNGFEVFSAGSMAEGLKLLDQENPDVIFLDNNLPDGFGWGIVDYIRKNHSKAKVNLISAYNVPKTSTTFFKIIEKPILLEDLNEFLENR